ncbi:MAG TPA: asparagine synthase (glutamine-hydrolyzing), partial [Bacteroidia bacterium]|nr:asparagine synthase (glutamine-hydrolyzing) [Bacteroidia bacterium]
GIVAENGQAYKEVVAAMTGCMSHRGPDGDGHHVYNRCVLGHRRLSIVDLERGWQPMFNHDKSIGIVFNGEIYGYQDLMEQTVYNYQSVCDTELLIAMYQNQGKSMLQQLPGMFAFAIWDEHKQTLFCARDRFGEKPFYYAFGKNGEFIFASEMKAILATGLVIPEIEHDSIAHYLKYLYVHPHKTIYKNVFALPPAHCLEYSPVSRNLKTERYWHLPETNTSISLEEATGQFAYLLENAVKKQLVADVPVGAFLSGGLDSSTIVALASKYKQGIKTISFGFGDSINELPYAQEIATKYNTHHIELQQRETDIAGLLLKMQDIYDEPFADSSNIPTYLISMLAKEHLTVILTGDAGDEMLGGYGTYKTLLAMMEGKKVSKSLIPLLSLALKVSSRFGLGLDSAKYKAAIKNTEFSTLQDAHKQLHIYFTDKQINDLGLKGKVTKPAYSFKPENTPNDGMRADIEDYMPGDILVKTDRAAMASSVELRAPFLDVDFAEFCISLPYNLKVNKTSDKYILREAMSHLWTDSIRKRSKQGFGAPVNHWLVLPGMQQLKNDYLLNKNSRLYSFVDYNACLPYFNKNNYHTWILLNLAMWLERWR